MNLPYLNGKLRSWLTPCFLSWSTIRPFPTGFLLILTLFIGSTPIIAVDYTELSIDELMHVEINSVSRKFESLFEAPAAVHLISNEDVKRSGMTSLAETLRMSPGLHVGRVDETNVAVASRGFNDVSSNKLLVMTDGRSVYSPLFSGVQWIDQQIIMEDLDRIEVIRGPGASLWGANAVNGVVNITTKSSKDTVGSFASVLLGDFLEFQAVGRHGEDLGNDRYIRFYAKHIRQAKSPSDSPLGDLEHSIEQSLVGFRYDWEGGERGRLTIQGDLLYGETNSISENFSLVPPFGAEMLSSGTSFMAYLLSRWSKPVGEEGELSVQGYLDFANEDLTFFGNDEFIADLDAQLRQVTSEHNEFVTGVGFRFYDDKLEASERFLFLPSEDQRWLLSAFFQNEFKAIPDKLHVTVSAKVEHTKYANFEFQPNLRVLFRPDENQALWASIARAARTPSRAERTALITGAIIPPNPLSPIPTKAIVQGNSDFRSEDLVALEVGHRLSKGDGFSIDTALFYNQYEHLRSIEPGAVTQDFTSVPHNRFTSLVGNGIEGSTYGVEITTNLQPTPRLRMQGTLSILKYKLENNEGSLDTESVGAYEGSSPETQLGLRVMYDITENWLFDVIGHHSSKLVSPGIDSYTALDSRLAWKPNKGFELSIVGRDLLESEHYEFPPTFLGGELKRIPRSYYLRANWKF
ncbi:MAG: TonB-dependent receptor [Verrucomicrobia bacterium]|nr:TonB-dependent receptor [Verrucomicrobiota bacterium]